MHLVLHFVFAAAHLSAILSNSLHSHLAAVKWLIFSGIYIWMFVMFLLLQCEHQQSLQAEAHVIVSSFAGAFVKFVSPAQLKVIAGDMCFFGRFLITRPLQYTNQR